jgi:rootletin
LIAQNAQLRAQLEESHRTNESLTNDLQKLTNDWESLRDEMLSKEDEWKMEEEVKIIIFCCTLFRFAFMHK